MLFNIFSKDLSETGWFFNNGVIIRSYYDDIFVLVLKKIHTTHKKTGIFICNFIFSLTKWYNGKALVLHAKNPRFETRDSLFFRLV